MLYKTYYIDKMINNKNIIKNQEREGAMPAASKPHKNILINKSF